MILTFLWQAMRMVASKTLNLKETPQLMKLCKEGESLSDIQKLGPEQILIRWVNYHLHKCDLHASCQTRQIRNLGIDLSDSIALFHVLNKLDSSKCTLDGIDEPDLCIRAQKMITNSIAIDVPDIVSHCDIDKANSKVATLFVAAIFNTKHGLEDLTKEEYEAASMLDDDVEGTKEERQFRFWINSLGIEAVYVNNLFGDFNDGILVNRVIHQLDENAIDWKKIDTNPNNDFKRNINNATGINACKDFFKLKMIGIGGPDLTKGHQKSILATVWQLAKLNYLKLIGNKSEEDLAKWANDLVGGRAPSITSLKDKSLHDGKFLLHLCSAIEPRSVNWDIMTEGTSEEELKNNAKYVTSVARKLGAVIFCVWEDIVNVNSKQMLIFFATMYEIQKNYVSDIEAGEE